MFKAFVYLSTIALHVQSIYQQHSKLTLNGYSSGDIKIYHIFKAFRTGSLRTRTHGPFFEVLVLNVKNRNLLNFGIAQQLHDVHLPNSRTLHHWLRCLQQFQYHAA